MNSLKLISRFVFLSAILLACETKPPKWEARPLEKTTLDKYLTSVYRSYPLPGLAVVLVTPEGAYSTTLGYSDLDAKIPFTDSTVFFAGRLSELMVSMTALKLQESDELSLADYVSQHLAYFEIQGPYQKVTLHHLFTHTSGIPHFSPAWDMPTFAEDALEGITRSIIFQELEFEPGTRSKLAPYNTDIAADVLQKVVRKPFEEVVDDVVLSPLNMHSSGFDIRAFDSLSLARPHQIHHWLTYEQRKSEIYPYTRENAGSFGFHTTTSDLRKWMQMLLGGGSGFLTTESMEVWLQRHYQTSPDTYKGYGWEIIDSGTGFIYCNQWSAGGFSADLSMIPEAGIGVFVLSNMAEDFNPTVISNQLLGYVQGAPLKPARPPVHIAMSHKLAEGICMEEVLDWHDQLLDDKDSEYEMNPALIGQLGINYLHRLSLPDEALQIFGYAVSRFPDSPQAHLNLAEALLMTGSIDEARAHFEQAVTLKAEESPYLAYLREQLQIAAENLADI